MPQSLSVVYMHAIFSTKNRFPFLKQPEIRDQMHRYLAGVSDRLGCAPLLVGGVEDHVHILARLGRTRTQADWIKELKRVSTLWVKGEHSALEKFEWQSGYGIFSVSRSNLSHVTDYILNQEEHHKTVSFQDEFRAFLRKHDLEWDERYVWD